VAIPDLDGNGFLPPGIHACTVDEVRAAFATSSPHRTGIFTGFEAYLLRLRNLGLPVELYVDGGYTTRKAEEPKDIDVVIDITAVNLNAAPAELRTLLDKDAMKTAYLVDPTPRHDLFAGQGDCREYFTYVREEIRQKLGLPDAFRKGLLKIIGWP
jgi:hypothetical protein